RLIIDEVQKVPQLLDALQYIIDNYHVQCVITGSSARKLKRGMSNLLGGRAVQRFLFPFIWNEIRDIGRLEEVLVYGTLPPVIITSNLHRRRDILVAYTETYIREEIQAEGIIRKVGSFSRFIDMAAAQFGEQVSYSEIARECQLPVMTVKSYYEILEDTLIGIVLKPYRKSIRKRLAAHPKVYFFDNGVVNAINGHLGELNDHSLAGRLFEQFIICETYRHLKYFQSNVQIYYWRTNTGAEVDLLLVRNNRITGAFEIKYSGQIGSTHLTGLRAFNDDNPGVPCYVICRADQPYTIGNVKIINWQDYLKILNKLFEIRR
ncbi:MAG: DUF4143 domain-containing protein, partial [Bacteroidia bacterium]|nr:DUF4143 domain-containing protein [Bacteroidia bacterium]